MHPTFHVSLLWLYSAGGTTLVPLDPIVTAGIEKEYEVKSISRHCQQGKRWNTWCTSIVIMKQRIVESQRSSPCLIDFTIVPACLQAYLRLNIRWDLPCHWTWSALYYDIRLGTIAELYRTYAIVYMGFTTVCFDVYAHKAGPSWFLSLYEAACVFEGFTSYIGI